MPAPIAKVHDRLMLRYMNGMSSSKKQGKILTVATSKKGNSRSVMIMPKLDYFLSDDIYVGALISVRKKNSYPIIYSDGKGSILGSNRLALKLINNGSPLIGASLFNIFPRLYSVYYPNQPSSAIDEGNQEAEGSLNNNSSDNDATTLNRFADNQDFGSGLYSQKQVDLF